MSTSSTRHGAAAYSLASKAVRTAWGSAVNGMFVSVMYHAPPLSNHAARSTPASARDSGSEKFATTYLSLVCHRTLVALGYFSVRAACACLLTAGSRDPLSSSLLQPARANALTSKVIKIVFLFIKLFVKIYIIGENRGLISEAGGRTETHRLRDHRRLRVRPIPSWRWRCCAVKSSNRSDCGTVWNHCNHAPKRSNSHCRTRRRAWLMGERASFMVGLSYR